MTISQWIPNFTRRLTQLARIQKSKSLNDVEVWLGGLFFPEAYITATRQAVSHRRNWSLETVHLQLDIEKIQDPNAFVVEG
jgi:dynein heavy chain 1, cytosolic